jgi:8-oxo-dGTP diphosphatase
MNNGQNPLDNKIVQVGVQTIYRRDGLILLGRRRKVFGDMTWALPGGRLEVGESIFQCARRELCEETGLLAESMKLSHVCDAVASANYYLQLGVDILSASGEINNCEPEYCDALDFFSLDNLPKPLFPPSEIMLIAIKAERFYAEIPL